MFGYDSTENIFFGTKKPMNDEHRTPLTAEEINRLLSAIDLSTAVGVRNATMVLLMISTGAKVGELVGKEGDSEGPRGGLLIGDYDRRAGTITLRRPKDGGERVLPIPVRIQQYLRTWLDSRPQLDGNDLVFVTNRGTRIQNRYVRRMLHEYGRAAGIDRDVRPSLLRHTYAQEVLRETGDLHFLKESLGHRHLASSIRYLEGREESER